MILQKHTVAIEVAKSPAEVFKCVNTPGKWWPEDVDGESTKLDDEFVFTSGDSHYSKNKIIELIPNQKVVWLVTDSIRKTDNFSWTDTKFIFELTPEGDNTKLEFTYDGFILDDEADRLIEVCDMVIKDMLYNFITQGKAK
ncbi:MAG: SRPBCC domain-containing protein [Bacteroidota bacterium]